VSVSGFNFEPPLDGDRIAMNECFKRGYRLFVVRNDFEDFCHRNVILIRVDLDTAFATRPPTRWERLSFGRTADASSDQNERQGFISR
jgi:hypothetical protein